MTILKWVSFVLLTVFTLSFFLVEALIITDAKGDPNPQGEVVIVLGAGLAGDQPKPILTERLNVALQYLRDHPETPVVVSGGQGSDEAISEAEAMSRFLEAAGVDPNRIIEEDRSTSTDENISYSLRILQQRAPVHRVIIVTSEFHLYRAKRLAAKYGLIAAGIPAKTPPLSLLKYLVREYFAVLASWQSPDQ